jgi:hypothetical protein
MTTRLLAAFLGGALLLSGPYAYGGTVTPNGPALPPDPCGANQCKNSKPLLCKTVTTHQCVEYQGNPPHCTRFQDSSRQVCS